ncbi:MAG TPA: hypothetical protein VGK93_10145, partial [Candidatus Eisenbacteria bacterium]
EEFRGQVPERRWQECLDDLAERRLTPREAVHRLGALARDPVSPDGVALGSSTTAGAGRGTRGRSAGPKAGRRASR